MKNSNNKQRGSTETRLARIERYVGQHHGEIKASYQGYGYTPTITGGTFMVSNVPQGDTVQQRTGANINLHRILRHAVFNMTSSCTIRIILYRDKFQEGVFPAVTDVLENADVTSTYNFVNVVQRKRFIILNDESQNFTIGGKLTHSSLKSVPHNCKVNYNGTTSTITDQRSNSIFMLVISDTTTPGNINFTTQVQYTDE